jgi:PAN domain
LASFTGTVFILLAAVAADGQIAASPISSSNDILKDWSCPMYGLDNFGEDIEEVENVASWEDCGWLCQNRDGCVIWVWRHERTGDRPRTCFLKYTISDREAEVGSSVSGAKGCFTRC